MLNTRFAFRSALGGAEGLGVVAAVWGGRLFGAQDGAVCGLALRQSNTGQYPAAKATGGRTACGQQKTGRHSPGCTVRRDSFMSEEAEFS